MKTLQTQVGKGFSAQQWETGSPEDGSNAYFNASPLSEEI